MEQITKPKPSPFKVYVGREIIIEADGYKATIYSYNRKSRRFRGEVTENGATRNISDNHAELLQIIQLLHAIRSPESKAESALKILDPDWFKQQPLESAIL